MNAGGTGGSTPLALTADGVTEVFASNVLGHAALVDQAGIIADFADPTIQGHAYEAVHRFLAAR